MSSAARSETSLVARLSGFWKTLHEYLIAGLKRRPEPLNDPQSLRHFLETRASYIAQTSLYGYLRTRAGMRYPELFDDDVFVASINGAKWHMWLACVSDLAVYLGGMLRLKAPGSPVDVGRLMRETVNRILEDAGVPEDADNEFPEHAGRVRARLEHCDWNAVTDDEGPFSESPAALVRYAPIIEELKQLDAEVVMNSVRFHWQEVRRHVREHMDAEAVLQAARDANVA
jgi:hypothetical protein